MGAAGRVRFADLDDLEAFGMIPEFLGRLQVIAPLENFSIDDHVRILPPQKSSSFCDSAKTTSSPRAEELIELGEGHLCAVGER
jgi:hypothetical protein